MLCVSCFDPRTSFHPTTSYHTPSRCLNNALPVTCLCFSAPLSSTVMFCQDSLPIHTTVINEHHIRLECISVSKRRSRTGFCRFQSNPTSILGDPMCDCTWWQVPPYQVGRRGPHRPIHKATTTELICTTLSATYSGS